MSTQTEETYIPGDEEASVTTGSKAWRFANGKIVRGAELSKGSGTYPEERKRVVGKLTRVGIFEGRGKTDGQPYSQVEADIETSNGEVHIKGSLTDPMNPGTLKPSISTIKFAWGLTQVKKGDLIVIETALGQPVKLPNGRDGGCPTYVNFSVYNGKKTADDKYIFDPIYSPKRDPKAPSMTTIEQWHDLKPQIEAHDAYGIRVNRDDEDGPTHLSELCKECTAKGWPTPEENPNGWLMLLQNAYEEPSMRATLNSWNDDDWGEVRQLIQGLDECPQAIKPAAQAAKKKPSLAGAKAPADPFKNE